MRYKPHDLLVTLRTSGPVDNQLRKVHLYLVEHGVTRLIELDIRNPQYNSSPAELLDDAMAQLLAEVRARQQEKLDFVVWYYTIEERDVVESAAAKLAAREEYWQRYADLLITKARLVNEPLPEPEAGK